MGFETVRTGKKMSSPPPKAEVVKKVFQTAISEPAVRYGVEAVKSCLQSYGIDLGPSFNENIESHAERVTQYAKSLDAMLDYDAKKSAAALNHNVNHHAHYAVSNDSRIKRVWMDDAGKDMDPQTQKQLDAIVTNTLYRRGIRCQGDRLFEVDKNGREVPANPQKVRDILRDRLEGDAAELGVPVRTYLHTYKDTPQQKQAPAATQQPQAKPAEPRQAQAMEAAPEKPGTAPSV